MGKVIACLLIFKSPRDVYLRPFSSLAARAVHAYDSRNSALLKRYATFLAGNIP